MRSRPSSCFWSQASARGSDGWGAKVSRRRALGFLAHGHAGNMPVFEKGTLKLGRLVLA